MKKKQKKKRRNVYFHEKESTLVLFLISFSDALGVILRCF